MNVNIWGPPTWDVLHSCAFLFDEKKLNSSKFFECLKVLLPCIYCRNSYAQFLEQVGLPSTGQSAPWLYKIHEMVNMKLFNQKLEKVFGPSGDCKKQSRALFVQPTFEVVQKRYLVNREEPIVWRSLNTMLLAFAMGFETNASSAEIMNAFNILLETILQLLHLDNPNSKNNTLVIELTNLLNYKSASKLRERIEAMKYSKIVPKIIKSSSVSANLIRAGSCINGSCY